MNVVMNDAKGSSRCKARPKATRLQRGELDVLLDLAAVGIEAIARRAGGRSREVKPAAHWVLATGNRGKVAELAALLAEAGLDLRVTAQSELGVSAPPETGATFVENALLKARHASAITGLPAIADDSGLVVAALGGAPASARRGSRASRPTTARTSRSSSRRSIRHRSTAAHVSTACSSRSSIAEDPAPLIAAGSWAGQIAHAPKGRRRLRLRPRLSSTRRWAARRPSSMRRKRIESATAAQRYAG